MNLRPRGFTSLVLTTLAGLFPLAGSSNAAPGVPEPKNLSNGMPVVVLEDHTLPRVSVSLWVHAGSKDEIETSAGYAHFLEHLAQSGTDATGPFEYQRLAHRWGGTLIARANYDRTSFTATGVPSALDEIVDAVASLAFRASLSDKAIDSELGTLSQEVRSYYDDPASVAFLESMRAAFPKHPYRFPPLGNYRNIGTLKHDPLSAFYKNLYVPNNMALVLAGDLDPARARELAQRAFGKIPASATLPPKPAPIEGFAGHEDKEKPLELNQPWTTLSFVGPGYRHPDRPAFEVLARALGDAGGSPIAGALMRKQAGSAAAVTYYRLEDAGLLYIGMVPATAEMSYTAASAALEEIAAFKKRAMKDDEVKRHVERLVKEERMRAERLDSLSESLGEAALFGGVRYYWDLPELYGRVNAAEVGRIAAKYLVGENLRLVVIVPRKVGVLPEDQKTGFHQTLDALGGAAKDGPPADFEKRLYSGEDAWRVRADAWGDPRDARAPRSPVVSSLQGGLAVVLQEDHRRPLCGVSLHLPFGSGDDPRGKEGLAQVACRFLSATPHVSGPGEAFRGRDQVLLLPEIQVSRDFTEIRFLASPADLRAGLTALAAAVLKPVVAEAAFEAVRKSVRETLDLTENDPSIVSLDLFREKVYAGHPYAHSTFGTAPGLAALTHADVVAFLASSVRPDGAALAVAGDIDRAEVQKLVRDLFGSWKRGGARSADRAAASKRPAAGVPAAPPRDATVAGAEAESTPAPPSKNAANARAAAGEFTRQLSAPRSSIVVGVPGAAIADPDFDDLRVLGAGLTILAFEDMVFSRRAAFSATTVPEALRSGGSLALAVVAQHTRRDEAVFDVQRLMRRLALQDLDQKDVDDFARVEMGRETEGLQGVLAVASALAYREAAGLGAASLRNGLAPRGPQTPEQFRKVAGTYLRPETWIVVRTGPPSP